MQKQSQARKAVGRKQATVGSRQSAVGSQNPSPGEVRDEVEMMMEKMLENLLTAQEAAEILGIDEGRVRLLCENKRIAAVKKGHAWIVYKPSAIKYMKTRRRGRPPSGKN